MKPRQRSLIQCFIARPAPFNLIELLSPLHFPAISADDWSAFFPASLSEDHRIVALFQLLQIWRGFGIPPFTHISPASTALTSCANRPQNTSQTLTRYQTRSHRFDQDFLSVLLNCGLGVFSRFEFGVAIVV